MKLLFFLFFILFLIFYSKIFSMQEVSKPLLIFEEQKEELEITEVRREEISLRVNKNERRRERRRRSKENRCIKCIELTYNKIRSVFGAGVNFIDDKFFLIRYYESSMKPKDGYDFIKLLGRVSAESLPSLGLLITSGTLNKISEYEDFSEEKEIMCGMLTALIAAGLIPYLVCIVNEFRSLCDESLDCCRRVFQSFINTKGIAFISQTFLVCLIFMATWFIKDCYLVEGQNESGDENIITPDIRQCDVDKSSMRIILGGIPFIIGMFKVCALCFFESY